MTSGTNFIYRVRLHRFGQLVQIKYFSDKKMAEEYVSRCSKLGDEFPCGVLEVPMSADPRFMCSALELANLKEQRLIVDGLGIGWSTDD